MPKRRAGSTPAIGTIHPFKPPRVCRRLHFLRGWSNEQTQTLSPGWRRFLIQYAKEIWACDMLTVRTIWFRTLYVFFIILHGTREVVHVRVTAHPSSNWLAQQMTEACGTHRDGPRYLIHDRDGCFGAVFNRRVHALGMKQIRTPVKAPRANAIAERWIRTARSECLDHRFIFGHQSLQRLLNEYVAYYNCWRLHRSLGQKAPCASVVKQSKKSDKQIVTESVLGGLHHVYRFAA